ncbi:MAG: GGDEF domain-containing protein [Myxococcales bacterium]|nr:GGDEF domain-containing protein [Myxococcales bacterium]
MADEEDREGEYLGDTSQTTQQLTPIPDAPVGAREHGMLHVLAGPHNGAIFMIDQPVVTMGRGSSCQIYLVDQGISREHARIVRRDEGFYLEDAGSRNGTFCQREQLDQPRKLLDGDRIALGAETVMRFGLQDRIEREASRQTVELMIRDPLTQLFNRRQLDERLKTEFAYARRHDTSLHALMVDLDHFKPINDRYGHQAGDRVLREVARCLEHVLRVEDVVGRYGGEEFLIAIRGVDELGACALGERLRSTIEGLRIKHLGNPIPVTVSVGVGQLRREHEAPEDLLRQADEALYEAKSSGRNCIAFR